MSFGEFLEWSQCSTRAVGSNMPAPAASQPPRLLSSPVFTRPAPETMFISPALSLTLTSNMSGGGGAMGLGDGQGEMGGGRMSTVMGAAGELDAGKSSNNNNSSSNNRDLDGYESRSGSDNNMDAGSGDDQDADNPPRKKRYHRHTPQQIQELEALFKECPHPDEKQRLELSRRLNLESRQVKFWFQNRRTQMKTQLERQENSILRQENDKLRAENMSIRDAMRNPICTNCGGPALLGEMSLEEQHLRIENARLKDELDRVCTLAGKFLGRPIPSVPSVPHRSSLDLAVGSNGFSSPMVDPTAPAASLPQGADFITGPQLNVMGRAGNPERSMLAELALTAMDELVKMAQASEPLWIPSFEGGSETLNYEEYLLVFPRCIGPRPLGYTSEVTREMGNVIINSLALVETLMDAKRWTEMFPCIVSRATTTDGISSGMGGTRNGALRLMQAELQVLSPMVPVRDVQFLRFCKQHAEGLWAVVDVSVDGLKEDTPLAPYPKCRRLPSGCLVQDMPNGYSRVTWVEHIEYDDRGVHPLYQSLLKSGTGFGAQRWVANLQRQCECLALLMASNMPGRDPAAITPAGRRSMLKLAQRMTNNFCAGVSASTVHKWNKISMGNASDDVRVMTRKSIDDPGEPPGVVLSAATSVWLPISPLRLFNFLRDEHLRSQWDILSNGGPMQEMAHIAKGQDHGNCVSLLRANATNSSQSSMLILQETCTDAAGSLVVYAPVDIPAMHVVMSGGDSAYVALLPSGFAILPDGNNSNNNKDGGGGGVGWGQGEKLRTEGSLLTVAFQILVSSLPTAKLTVESVETVNNLISCTVQKIKAALNCEDA
ncbi:hypothetical protein AMTRI_Chr11g93270 [Amborella trichopoda]